MCVYCLYLPHLLLYIRVIHSHYHGMMVCICTAPVASLNIRPQAPSVGVTAAGGMSESVGRPPRPWVKIPSSTVNGLRYSSFDAFY